MTPLSCDNREWGTVRRRNVQLLPCAVQVILPAVSTHLLGIVTSSDHDSNRLSVEFLATESGEESYPVHDAVEQVGRSAEPGCTVGERDVGTRVE